MNKLRETTSTMWQAARYSIAFCMRHGRRTTFARLGIALATAAISYLAVQTTGAVFNSVQRVMGSPVHQYTFGVFVSDFGKPLAALSFVLLFRMVFGRLNWFFRTGWNNDLRRANEFELNTHRSTLDTARFRSKEYDDLSQHIEELPMGWQVRFFFAQEMLDLLSTLMSFAMFGAALLWYKPIYAVIIFAVSIPMMVMEFRFTTMWWTMYQEQVPIRKRRSVLERVYHTEVNFTQGIMFNQMPPLLKLIRQSLQESTNLFDSVRRFGVKREFITHFIAVMGLIGVIIHAVWSTVAFAGGFGTLSIIVAAALTFQSNLDSIVSMIADQWNNAKGIILIEKDFLGMKPVVETIDPIIPEFEGPPYIRFDRVSFTYPDTENQVLKNVSFTIEPGSKVAIVGKSGNGKSTVQALLMRHYDPTSGAIYVGDINLRNIRPADWTEFATTLMQKYRVLERLVGEEIASSRLDRPVDWIAVEESARFADFHGALVNDPQGFRTQIGVKFGGREFSGGENQRLALARAHYRKTPIFILDEPDASLDPDSAQRVIDNMFALEGVTVIIITQHISRSARCDKVIVMGKGEIIEQGRPEELMQMNGEYTRLFTLDKERLSANA